MLTSFLDNLSTILDYYDCSKTSAAWIYSSDFLRLIYASPQMETIWQIPNHEICRSPNQLFTSVINEDKAHVLKSFMAMKKNSNNDTFHFNYRIQRKNNETIRVFQKCFNLRDEAKKPIGICCVASLDRELLSSKDSPDQLAPTQQYFRVPISIGFKSKKKSYVISIANQEINLSLRQLECLQCLADGKTVKSTATKLHISPRTVQSYLNEIRVKTGCKNKLELLSNVLANSQKISALI